MDVDYYKRDYEKVSDRNKYNKFKTGEVENLSNYLRIWKTNPSYKDINTNISKIKIVSLVLLILFLIISTYIISSNLFIALTVGLLTMISFVFIFQDNIFFLRNFLSYHFRKFVSINPLDDFIFFFLPDEKKALYFSNKKDLVNGVLSIFKIETMPENIKPSLNQFIKSLHEHQIPYTYQVIQKPLQSESNNRYQINSTLKSYTINIFFSVYHTVTGILTHRKLEYLQNIIEEYSEILSSNFISNFHHFKLKHLKENEIVDALRCYTLKIDTSDVMVQSEHRGSKFRQINASFLLKIFLIGYIISYTIILLVILNISLTLIALIILTEIAFILFIWWRECLSQFTLMNLKHNNSAEIVEPLKDVDFFLFRSIPDSIYAFVNNKLLINIKTFNLVHASPMLYADFERPFCYPDKFFMTLIGKKILFNYTVMLEPMSYYEFDKEGYNFLKERTKGWLLRDIKNEKAAKEWLDMRAGMWRTILNISAFSHMYINTLNSKYVEQLNKKLRVKAITMKNAFKMNFQNFELIPLTNNKIISSFLCDTLKNKNFRLNGTHLNYIIFQGKALNQITDVSRPFKKGVEAIIGAEFNSPLQLENFITFGKTINTEFLEEEIPAGLTNDQIHNLLITNGTSKSRESLAMKIVSELIMANIPSIIFDFTGNWSKIIKYFKGSQFEQNILYFKLGSTFSIDPLHSGISYDKNNIDYLDYISDSFALAFNKNNREMAIFTNMITKTPEIDISQINLELKNALDWNKNINNDTVFNDFAKHKDIFFHSSTDNLRDNLNVIEFIQNDKTIIIDLKKSNDKNEQIFLTFIFLSKFIHFINQNTDFVEKLIVIPSMDLFFDGNFLDKNANKSKISKFLNPFFENDFGLLFLVNQIHYLHPEIFDYFQNFITFRNTDNRDISVLKNLLKLEDTYGQGSYYSPRRNTTYQIRYLMSMKPEEVLMKRSDIYQSFPLKIDTKEFLELKPLKNEEIIEFMNRQGYDLKLLEQQLSEQTKKTIFEKDLGIYSHFWDEIKKYLQALKKVDKVALYERKIKEELQKYIYQKAIKLTQNKKQIISIRDDLFKILVKHGYLVECHPKNAGGSEAIITCYSVGPQFEKALKDTYENKKDTLNDISVDTLEKESGFNSNFENFFQPHQSTENEDFEKEMLKDAVVKIMYEKYFDLFNVYKCINRKNYIKALEIEKQLMKSFLIDLYYEIYNVDYVISKKDLENLIDNIKGSPEFPFEKQEILTHLERCENVDNNDINLDNEVREIYSYLSNFFNVIQEKAIET